MERGRRDIGGEASGGLTRPRIFTVDEANSMIPELEIIVRGLATAKRQVIWLQDKIHVLEVIWGPQLGREGNPDGEEYAQHLERLHDLVEEMNTYFLRLERMGCLIKDIDEGLVDFYASIGGRLAFLCWRAGEREIGYWHEITSGYAGRKPLLGVD